MLRTILKYIAITTVVLFGGAVVLLSTRIGGIRAFVVQSASMEPTISTGSLLLTKQVHPTQLVTGDIITFIRPDKSREFITHRITTIRDNQGVTVITTKGDNNPSDDTWQLAGGGVVGKMLFSVPFVGYLLSLAKTKIGIMLLILVPALFIISDEILKIVKLIKEARKPKPSDPTSIASLLIIATAVLLHSTSTTNALLSDTVTLTNSIYTAVTITPTPTSTISPTPVLTPTATPTVTPPPPCGEIPDAIIEGNGAGSTNEIIISNTCSQSTTQESTTDVTVIINTSSNTGGNSVTGNASSSTSIQTSTSQSTTTVTTSTP